MVSQAMMQGSVPAPIREKLIEHFRNLHSRSVEMVRAAQREGTIDDSIEAEELAAALICVMRGMSIRMPSMPDLPFAPPRTDTILRLLRPPTASQVTRRPRKQSARGKHVARSRRT